MATTKKSICTICKGEIGIERSGWDGGHNAQPINDGRCCLTCNDTQVIPARLVKQFGWSLEDAQIVGQQMSQASLTQTT